MRFSLFTGVCFKAFHLTFSGVLYIENTPVFLVVCEVSVFVFVYLGNIQVCVNFFVYFVFCVCLFVFVYCLFVFLYCLFVCLLFISVCLFLFTLFFVFVYLGNIQVCVNFFVYFVFCVCLFGQHSSLREFFVYFSRIFAVNMLLRCCWPTRTTVFCVCFLCLFIVYLCLFICVYFIFCVCLFGQHSSLRHFFLLCFLCLFFVFLYCLFLFVYLCLLSFLCLFIWVAFKSA